MQPAGATTQLSCARRTEGSLPRQRYPYRKKHRSRYERRVVEAAEVRGLPLASRGIHRREHLAAAEQGAVLMSYNLRGGILATSAGNSYQLVRTDTTLSTQ